MSGPTPSTRMRAEIDEAPTVIRRLLVEAEPEVTNAAAAIRRARPRWVTLAGRGTSDHAALYARYLFEAQLGIPAGLAAPSIRTVYRASVDRRGQLVIAASQSGRSPDVLAVVADARRQGALTIAVTNDDASPLAVAAHHVIRLRAGHEESVAATKTYLASLVAVAALVARIEPALPLAVALPGLPSAIGAAIEAGAAWLRRSRIAATFARSDRALVLSRGYNLATAMETALKLKETAGLFAEGYSTADLEHGPIALADEGVPVLAFRAGGAANERIDPVVQRVRRTGADVWTVSAGKDASGFVGRRRGNDVSLEFGLPEALSPIALAVPGLLLAELVARLRGRDPDAPAGLAKITLTT